MRKLMDRMVWWQEQQVPVRVRFYKLYFVSSNNFHPYEIGFVIIDFKGGGMVNQFRNLPHLIGAITNIDGNEVQRSLKSIKAELMKRQNLFAEAGVNHIDINT